MADVATKVEIWTIHPDGSGLKQFSYSTAPAVTNPIWSLDGTRLGCLDLIIRDEPCLLSLRRIAYSVILRQRAAAAFLAISLRRLAGICFRASTAAALAFLAISRRRSGVSDAARIRARTAAAFSDFLATVELYLTLRKAAKA